MASQAWKERASKISSRARTMDRAIFEAQEELESFLRELKLSDMYAPLRAYGVDCVEDLAMLDAQDHDRLAVKPFHRKKLLRGLLERCGVDTVEGLATVDFGALGTSQQKASSH